MRRTLILLTFAGLSISVAQTPQIVPGSAEPKPKKEEFRNKAPVSKEVLRVRLPKAVETHLDNGLTVLVLEDHRLPQIAMALELRGAGGLYDPPSMTGLAAMTAQMLREGTATRNSRQISEQLDLLAASMFGAAGSNSPQTVLNLSGLSDNFDQWFALATEILLHPSFPAEEWAKLKQRQLVALRQQRTTPGFLASERFSRAVYGSHPAATISPTPETLEAITVEAMKDWHDTRYTPQNAILGIVGDVKPAEFLPKLKQAFGSWKKSGLSAKLPADPAPNPGLQVLLVNRPGSVQTNLMMGNIAINRRSPDYVAMNVLNEILGGSFSSRLFNNLREDKGYTYGAYSGLSAGEFPGPWQATSEVRTEVTEGAMREFFNEFRRIRDDKVPASELEEKKRSLVARFALSLESPQQLLNYAITRKIHDLPENYWDTYPAQISAVTAEDVQRVARKYLTLDNIQIVAVGDVTKIRPIMEKYGKVAVYGMDGAAVVE